MIRNAGGVVTDDEIRSLAISQRLLGTEEIILIHHTDCGMLTFTDDDFKRQVQDDTGIKPEWAAEAFADLDEDVRQSIARIKASPFIPDKDSRARLRLRGRDRQAARGQLSGGALSLAHRVVGAAVLGVDLGGVREQEPRRAGVEAAGSARGSRR